MLFHKISLEDRSWVNRCLKADDRQACEYSFANNYIWRDIYQVEVAKSQDCAVIRFQYDGEVGYSYPFGNGNKKKVIHELLSMCREQGIPLQMSPLSEQDKEDLSRWFPGNFLIEEDRDAFDYVYSREKLATLSGRKLHGKRNHIARFKEGNDWRYERMTKAHIDECMQMADAWAKIRGEKWNQEMEEELSAAYEAMKHMDELGLVGGVLYKGETLAAFTIGEQLNSDTFVVHFEKALPDIQGAYPMINQQFVLDACADCRYVNREEDTGDLSLRRAKLSYHPEILLKKYIAESSRVAFGDKNTDQDAICEIWQECFGDDREDIAFYLEHRMTENNMLLYWKDSRPVAMASFLPAVYIHKEKRIPVRYVYAVGTLPAYRNQKIASELLELGEAYWKEPLVLCPAEGTLWDYYGRLGFQKAFCCSVMDIVPGGEEESIALIWEQPAAAEYKMARDARFSGNGYLEWSEDAIAFALSFHKRFGGECVRIMRREADCEENLGWILYHMEENCVVIVEHTLSDDSLSQAAAHLLASTQREKIIWKIPGGMIRSRTEDLSAAQENGYLNLAMD